jgi:hypothetical protein
VQDQITFRSLPASGESKVAALLRTLRRRPPFLVEGQRLEIQNAEK